MFVNSVPNSDSEQCIESKLSWVRQVHTLTQPTRTDRAHCAQAVHVAVVSQPIADRVPAYGGSCRRLGWRCRRLGWPCRKPDRSCRILYRDTPSTKAMRARRVARYSACCRPPPPPPPPPPPSSSWRAQACMPAQPVVCLLSLPCAYSACCVLIQSVACLLSLLCACSTYCVPQYSLLYCDSILENGQ